MSTFGSEVDAILAKADQKIAQWEPLMDSVQAKIFAERGVYVQFKNLLERIPENDELVPLNEAQLLDKPSDEEYDWKVLSTKFKLPLPITSYVQMKVDVYQCAQGHGYIKYYSVIINNQTYTKAIGYGPMDEVSHTWNINSNDDEVNVE